MLNSRAKDFYDLWSLSRSFTFEGEVLCEAIRATFDARNTPVPEQTPIALTPVFFGDAQQMRGWSALLRRIGLNLETSFADVGARLNSFLWPPLSAIGQGDPFTREWSVEGAWKPRSESAGEDS